MAFRRWAPLKSWTEGAIRSLSYVSRTENATHNRVVVGDSRKNEWMWFIVQVGLFIVVVVKIKSSSIFFKIDSKVVYYQGSCDVLRLVNLEKSREFSNYLTMWQNTPNQLITCHHDTSNAHGVASDSPLLKLRRRPQTSVGFNDTRKSTDMEESSPKGSEECNGLNSNCNYAAKARQLNQAVQRVLTGGRPDE